MTQEPKRPRKIPNYRINTFTTAPSHPLGVKPSGNALLVDQDVTTRNKTKEKLLGHLSKFPEDFLMELVTYVNAPRDLQSLGLASRILYAYTYDEELWRKLYTKEFIRLENKSKDYEGNITPFGCQSWRGSWRKTVLKLDEEALIHCGGMIFSDLLYRPYQCSQIDYQELFKKVIEFESQSSELGYNLNKDFGITRLDEAELSLDDFKSTYVNKPFILQSKSAMGRWPDWNLDYLLRKFPHEKFRQEAVKWDLSLYAQYYRDNRDESPLYLFDCNSKAMKSIVEKYEAPKIYQDDLFKLFQEDGVECRPDHRWLIVGPARSGSTFHKDPNYTSAWNAGLSGVKLWVMLPPGVKPPGVSTDKEEEEVTSPVGIAEWVLSGYYNDSVRLAQEGQCLIGITFPGECIYVPSGWWHSVINLTDSVALTENFVPEPVLPKVLNFFKNKKNQISGFHLKDFVASVRCFLEAKNSETSDPNRYTILKNFLAKSTDYPFDNEDCGLGDRAEFETPMYEFFVELIAQSKYKGCLPEAIEEMKAMEVEVLKEKMLELRDNVRESEIWNKLTEDSKNIFSFGFDSTNDDVD